MRADTGVELRSTWTGEGARPHMAIAGFLRSKHCFLPNCINFPQLAPL